jgi:uncharacterized heparinase superfamily protein
MAGPIAYAAAIRHLGLRRAWLNLLHRTRARVRRYGRYEAPRRGQLEFLGEARVPFPVLASPRTSLIGNRFTALGRDHGVGHPPDWDYPETVLWQFHLHYFDYLAALPRESQRQLVLDWLRRCRPRRDRPGWWPYPLSLRLRNWTKLLFDPPGWSAAERASILDSIEAQADCLVDGVEHHLGGNHLLENALTLRFLAACFSGRATTEWRRLGDLILSEQLDEQFAPDGGHFERSPMYHALLAGALLDLVNVLDDRDSIRGLLLARLPSILGFVSAIRHPDGDIALFNDSALETAPEPASLLEYAAQLDVSADEPVSGLFLETGYCVWKQGRDAILVDCGPVGPDYVPAHAHGDIFSFELSLRGQRVVVDGGTSTYEAGAERSWARSTRAHNTVEVAGADQCEFFGAFRVGRRGRPRDVRARSSDDGLELEGWHDGYRRLVGRPVHHREIRFLPPGVILVWDAVESDVDHPAVSRIHLVPGAAVHSAEGSRARITLATLALTLTSFGGELGREPGQYAPRFGERVPCEVIRLSKGRQPTFGYALAPADVSVAIDAAGATVEGRRIARRSSRQAGMPLPDGR